MQEEKNTNRQEKSTAGRKPLEFPAIHIHYIYLNESDMIRFENLFDLSGFKYRGHFIRDKVLNSSLKIIKIDKTAIDFVIKLSQLRGQFRKVATNYNQILKLLKEQLGEQKALTYLYKLEKTTIELVKEYKEIESKIQILERKYLSD